MISFKKQQGAVLLVAIIILLLITIIGVSAVSTSGIKTQVAGNNIFGMLVYQGAESALAKSVTGGAKINIKNAAEVRPNSYTVPPADLPTENVQGGGRLISTATVTAIGVFPCPIISGVANSSNLNCEVYQVDAQARLVSTGARARHMEGRAILLPPVNP